MLPENEILLKRGNASAFRNLQSSPVILEDMSQPASNLQAWRPGFNDSLHTVLALDKKKMADACGKMCCACVVVLTTIRSNNNEMPFVVSYRPTGRTQEIELQK